ncbi:anti-sigma factor family protein [Melittangium boletus]|uniref:anti-sigma factor family protein n=1 Tax=Melittangium boletus TaxID=83453 RepID=UPI003DA2BC7B
MPAQLSHRETRALFIAFADEDLPADKAGEVRSHLDGCGECQRGWQSYSATVQRLKAAPRHAAPPALATQVMTRVKRQRRSGLRGLTLMHAHYRLPVEILVPVLLAAAVAAYLLMAGV